MFAFELPLRGSPLALLVPKPFDPLIISKKFSTIMILARMSLHQQLIGDNVDLKESKSIHEEDANESYEFLRIFFEPWDCCYTRTFNIQFIEIM